MWDFRAGGDAAFIARYAYVTGRAGRVTGRELHLCVDCAAKFAKRNGLTLPTDTCGGVSRRATPGVAATTISGRRCPGCGHILFGIGGEVAHKCAGAADR